MNEHLQDMLAEILQSMLDLFSDGMPEEKYDQLKNDIKGIERMIEHFKNAGR